MSNSKSRIESRKEAIVGLNSSSLSVAAADHCLVIPELEDVQPDVEGTSLSPAAAVNHCLTDIPERERPTVVGQRAQYLKQCVPLYKAAMNGDWRRAEAIILRNNHIVRTAITSKLETALHIAAAAKRKGFVKNLLAKMTDGDLALRNKDGNTAICFAAASGVKEIAKMMVDRNRNLPLIRGNGGMTPLYIAALFGHREMVLYLYDETDFNSLTDGERINLFHIFISADIYDMALLMLKDYPSLATSRNQAEETGLHLMARRPCVIASSSRLGIFKRLINSMFKGIYHEALMQTLAHQLVDNLWKQIVELPDFSDRKVSELIRTPSRLLFDAAATGNTEFLIILIRSYPELIWKVDEKKRSLFHVAAMNRQESVFNLIYELGAIKDLIAAYKEESTRNNMLHLVAELPPAERLQIVSGAALQMQRELLWFREVKKIVPRSYIKTKNSSGELPQDLFTKGHQGLRKEGEKWMKDTATSCMLVATLIATVVFAAAFTVPGGNNDDDGIPIFQNKLWFKIFLIADAVALFSSSISIGIFLSILTSRYAEEDFLVLLPARLMLGLLALFVSILAMILAFSGTLVLVRNEATDWILILIVCLSSVTGLSFVLLHVRLWLDTLRSAYWSKFLFQERHQGLYQ